MTDLKNQSIWDFSAPLSDMVALQKLMTDVLLPQLEVITPGSGTYLNEVRIINPTACYAMNA